MSQVDIMPKGLNWDWLNSEQDSLEFNWVGSLQRGGVSLLLDSWRKLPWDRRDWGGTDSKSQECAGRSFKAAWGWRCSWQLLGSQRCCSPKAGENSLAPIMHTTRVHVWSWAKKNDHLGEGLLFRRGEGQRTVDTSLKDSASFSVSFQMPLTCWGSEAILGLIFGPCVSSENRRASIEAVFGGAQGGGFWDPAGVCDKVFPIFTVPE